MQLLESAIPPLTAAALWMIICKRPVPPDDHLQEASPSVSSFARGQPLRMTICKWSVPSDHHLQEASPSGWSSARGRSLWIIICKRPTTPDDHLQEAGPSGSSFARGRPFWMTICKRPVPLDHHLQEAGPSRWPSARGRSLQIIICKRLAPHFDNHKKGMKNAFFETLHNEIKCVLSVKESNYTEKKIKIFTFVYGQGRGGCPPPPLTVSPTVKYPFFYDSPNIINWISHTYLKTEIFFWQ